MALYIGFDSSTQSLTAVVIAVGGPDRRIVFERTLQFDEVVPQYMTRHGVLPSEDGRTVVAPTAMWADALDRMMAILASSGLTLSDVRALSGAAQQHGSVYLSKPGIAGLSHLDPERPLAPQVSMLLSRPVSPVWLDSSTTSECRALTSAVGGDAALARLTGSRAYERFTAAQIRKFAMREPDAFAATARIHLVSSFMASLLAGREAPLEPGDASGMNLMDLASRTWSPAALSATAPDLLRRLPPIRESWTVAGDLAPYWQRRYGFSPARVVAWTGDNPSSLIGLGLHSPGQLAISLGTSDTVFGPIASPAPDPNGAGHVFGSPAGGYMALTCFANGSLAREHIRDDHRLDWSRFSAALRRTAAGNGGALMLPWFVPEITPHTERAGVRRLGLDPGDADRNVRAVVEAQAMSMRVHSRWIADHARTIRATGGAAENEDVLQVIADVFDAEVVRLATTNSGALGAALRAYHADCLASGHPIPWDEVVAGFTDPAPGPPVRPRAANVAVYAELAKQYERFEESGIKDQAGIRGQGSGTRGRVARGEGRGAGSTIND
jgi:xylulokinase